MQHRRTVLTAGAALAAVLTAAPAQPAAAAAAVRDVPLWLFPTNPPTTDAAVDPIRLQFMHGSNAAFTWPQLKDLSAAVDWYPQTHTPMPEVVAHGRPPLLSACGYCHTPAGQGRPENAPLAALPAAYIIQQVLDFKSGARRSAGPAAFSPNGLMVEAAEEVGPEELAAAAAYFAAQPLRRRVTVLERARIPHLGVVGMVYARNGGPGDELLGERLVEVSPNPERHEMRDEAMTYVAYVPPGSIARGRILATTGRGPTSACISCHGADLHGSGVVPRIAGISPTYVLRQLIALQRGARGTAASQLMQPVVARLTLRDMIDAAAYAASLPTVRQATRNQAAAPQAALSAE